MNNKMIDTVTRDEMESEIAYLNKQYQESMQMADIRYKELEARYFELLNTVANGTALQPLEIVLQCDLSDLKRFTDIDAQNDYNSDKILYIPIDSIVVENSNYCKFCDGVSFSEEPFTVITHKDKKVECIFRFCPNCGRKLSEGE